MSSELGPIVITAREVYNAVMTLSGKVDVLITQQSVTQQNVTDHETRLRSLERRMWAIPSLAAVLSVASVLVALVHHA